jgi:large subunit ribosomal protein L29
VSKQAEAVNLLRTFTAEDLEEHLRQQRRRLFEVRFQQAAGQVENHRQVRELRREIARTMTLQLELARGHHLASDLEVEPEPEEQPQPRRFRRRRESVEPAVEAGLAGAGMAGEEVVEAGEVEAGEVEAAEAEAEPAGRPRRTRRRRETVAAAAEAEIAGEDAELDEGAPGPDEEQTDE